MRVATSVSIGLAIGVLAQPASALQAPVAARTVLTDLRQETGETFTRLLIAGSARPTFAHYSPDPLTLVVDIADADSSRLPVRLEVATREVESLRVSSMARADGQTNAHIEVRLATLAPFTVEEIGNDVVVTVSRQGTDASLLPPVGPMDSPALSEPPPLEVTDNPAPAPRATRIFGVTRLLDDRTGYHVEANGTLKPETFFLKNPNRLVIDFPDVVIVRGQSLPELVDPVRAIRLAQFSSAPPRVARLVLEVDGSTPYDIVPDDTGVLIVFGAGDPPAQALLGAPAETPVAPVNAPIVLPEPVHVEEPVTLPRPPEVREKFVEAPAFEPAPKPAVRLEPIAQAPPPPKAASLTEPPEEAPKFTGQPISLDFKDGDIIDLFRLMSEISGLNIIVNPGIGGKVSLTVREVPWDQALDLVLKTQGLGYALDGNVVRIARLADLDREMTERANLKKSAELAGERVNWQGRLSYLDGALVKGILEKTVLSDKGTFTPAGDTAFIVNDLPQYVEAAKKLVAELDRPAAQVEIEARIVISTREYARALGVQWGFLNQQAPQYGNTTNLSFPNSIILNGQSLGAVTGEGLATGAGIGQAGRGYMVNLPVAANTALGVSLGNILGSFNLDAALTVAENSGKIRTISSPRITAQNKVQATIKQGTQIPYQTTSNGTVTTTFKDATLTLAVTPTINEAGTVLLEVQVDNNSPGPESSGGVTINTQSAATTVLVKDGATTVLGGVYSGSESFSKTNTPFLSQIPILGMLFKNRAVKNSNYELLIFITPRIVR